MAAASRCVPTFEPAPALLVSFTSGLVIQNIVGPL